MPPGLFGMPSRWSETRKAEADRRSAIFGERFIGFRRMIFLGLSPADFRTRHTSPRYNGLWMMVDGFGGTPIGFCPTMEATCRIIGGIGCRMGRIFYSKLAGAAAGYAGSVYRLGGNGHQFGAEPVL
jgi:hypothetical protein